MNMMKTGSGVKLKADFDKIFKALVIIYYFTFSLYFHFIDVAKSYLR